MTRKFCQVIQLYYNRLIENHYRYHSNSNPFKYIDLNKCFQLFVNNNNNKNLYFFHLYSTKFYKKKLQFKFFENLHVMSHNFSLLASVSKELCLNFQCLYSYFVVVKMSKYFSFDFLSV